MEENYDVAFSPDAGPADVQLRSDAAWSLIIRGLSIGLGFFMFVVLARTLSPKAYGQFAFAYNIAFSVGLIAAMGQPIAIVRFLPEYLANRRFGEAWGAVLFGVALSACAGILGFGVILATFGILAGLHHEGGMPGGYAIAAGVFSFLISISEYGTGVLRAAGKILPAIFVRDTIWRLAFPALIVAQLALGITATAVNAIWLAVVALLFVIIWQAGAIRSILQALPGTRTVFLPRLWLTTGLRLWVMVLLTTLLQNVDTLVVAGVFPPVVLGQYFNAAKGASLLSLPLVAANLVYAPMISVHYHSKDIRRLQNVCREMSRSILILSVLGFVLLYVFGADILRVFGPSYTSATGLLRILCIGSLVNALCGASGGLLAFTTHERTLIHILAATLTTMVIAMPIAIWTMGPMGAALVAVGGQVMWNVWASARGLSLVGVDPTVLSLLRLPRLRMA